ncbi:DgyrCDS12650 [Dimorphilus gyrociliatus]|uniref:DgyrCDS12650 n=1 Tax=Dimorphilus gyrociliatus TaxID=2664684 RepID=A0A7I8W883_9ANNE|nr:DgyrCDS12650 [Dimorphilus gyrociliatus]
MKSEVEQVKTLLKEAVKMICQNYLPSSHISVEGLLGITLDKTDVFLINLKEDIYSGGVVNSSFRALDQVLPEKKRGSAKRKSSPVQLIQKRPKEEPEALNLCTKKENEKTLLNVPVFPDRELPFLYKETNAADVEPRNGDGNTYGSTANSEFRNGTDTFYKQVTNPEGIMPLVPTNSNSEVLYGSQMSEDLDKKKIKIKPDVITEEMLSGRPIGDGVKDRRRECPICHKILSEPAKMRRHVATVHGKVRHQCPLCAGTYTRRDNMLTHMRIIHPEAVHLYTKVDDRRLKVEENAEAKT